MIVCEYFYKEFNAMGNDEYIHSWSSVIDDMTDEGWEVLDCIRRPGNCGMWTVLLGRSVRNGSSRKLGQENSKNCLD